MAKTSPVPIFVRLGNVLTTTLLRAGINLVGPGGPPMYLLTVRGRKSGQPRTTPIVVIQQDGKRYLVAPFGVVDWVRNLRAAGEAVLTRGRRSEKVQARELFNDEAGLVLKRSLAGSIPSFLEKYFELTPIATLEDCERAAQRHPVFLLQSAG
jgi:deazaflavin-dependent oxidoreductase (nitroreductase family)